MKIRAALPLFALLLAACLPTPQPSLENQIMDNTEVTSQPTDGGIEGTVTIGPSCPVVQVDVPCPDTPLQATFTVFTTTGNKVIEFQTDEQGHFKISLSPGDYVLHLETPKVNRFTTDTPFNVAENQYTLLDIKYDSGIR
ncbi:MAG: hypothetical protein HY863_04430 [Chloroflexi bacterium]|nr:hypothetical protein [Chloroflexota bacterium]